MFQEADKNIYSMGLLIEHDRPQTRRRSIHSGSTRDDRLCGFPTHGESGFAPPGAEKANSLSPQPRRFAGRSQRLHANGIRGKAGKSCREATDEVSCISARFPASKRTSSGPLGHLPRARGRQNTLAAEKAFDLGCCEYKHERVPRAFARGTVWKEIWFGLQDRRLDGGVITSFEMIFRSLVRYPTTPPASLRSATSPCTGEAQRASGTRS